VHLSALVQFGKNLHNCLDFWDIFIVVLLYGEVGESGLTLIKIISKLLEALFKID